MRSPISATTLLAALLSASANVAAADNPAAQLTAATGDVKVRAPASKDYAAVQSGVILPDGSRLKTADGAEATLKFADGSETKVRPKSEIIVRARPAAAGPNGVTVFVGRVWSSVVKSGGGATSFEVQSANAVAGVRGTEFEVGVALDGSTRVVVKEGEVGVKGESDGGGASVKAGQEVESDSGGSVARPKKQGEKEDWDGWFSARAKQMEKAGLEVARDLDGRLNKRKAKVEALVKEQKELRKQIEALEAKKRAGQEVGGKLDALLAKLEKTTARLEDMRTRLEGAFGLFETWGQVAKKGGIANADKIAGMAEDVARVAADFADMIEEGTDLSEEGMHDMMKEMQQGKSSKPEKNAGEELFK